MTQDTRRKLTTATASHQANAGNEDKKKLQQQDFTITRVLHEGQFSKVYLARPECIEGRKNPMGTLLVLKSFKNTGQAAADFKREMDLNYFLSPHPNIVTSYQVPFEWGENVMYPMEYAPFGSLAKHLRTKDGAPTPLQECDAKLIAQQLAKALDFMHGLNLVHREVCPQNILVFQRDFSLIKLGDFGSVAEQRACVAKLEGEICESSIIERPRAGSDSGLLSFSTQRKYGNKCGYFPPEFCCLLPHEKFHCYTSYDVWQAGILIFACLVGGFTPWFCADVVKDSSFAQYVDWHKRKCIKTPVVFDIFTQRFQRLLKRLLEPKPTKRCGITEIGKYLKDDWLESRKSEKRTVALSRAMSDVASTKTSSTIVKRSSTKRNKIKSIKRKADNQQVFKISAYYEVPNA